MGEMSSMVSRRPSSRNHSKEALWMSIRVGLADGHDRDGRSDAGEHALPDAWPELDLPRVRGEVHEHDQRDERDGERAGQERGDLRGAVEAVEPEHRAEDVAGDADAERAE